MFIRLLWKIITIEYHFFALNSSYITFELIKIIFCGKSKLKSRADGLQLTPPHAMCYQVPFDNRRVRTRKADPCSGGS